MPVDERAIEVVHGAPRRAFLVSVEPQFRRVALQLHVDTDPRQFLNGPAPRNFLVNQPRDGKVEVERYLASCRRRRWRVRYARRKQDDEHGEGYGAKIQKGGGNYRSDQDFVLFDVKVGDWWLQRHDIEDVASKLSLDLVPIIGVGTLYEMADMANEGFSSRWGEFGAEGIVARPATELCTRAGHRIITKIKHKDFVHERAENIG